MSIAYTKEKTLKLVKTHVIRCAQCKQWRCRIPQWHNAEGVGESCEHCGNTSIVLSDGRPIGPRSRFWNELLSEFNQLVSVWLDNELTDELAQKWFLFTVVYN